MDFSYIRSISSSKQLTGFFRRWNFLSDSIIIHIYLPPKAFQKNWQLFKWSSSLTHHLCCSRIVVGDAAADDDDDDAGDQSFLVPNKSFVAFLTKRLGKFQSFGNYLILRIDSMWKSFSQKKFMFMGGAGEIIYYYYYY